MQRRNQKYEDLLKSGHDLFWKYGFKRVTIDEICKKADVSKMTFYKHFQDKFELAKRVFDRVVEEGFDRYRKIINDESPAPEKIRKLIMMKVEGTNDISPEFINDFYTGSGEMTRYVENKTKEMWDLVIKDFADLQEKGIYRRDIKPELVIKIQTKIIELLDDKSVTSLYDSQQDLLMEFTKFMFYGVSPLNDQ
jgi:AcrR family transcriptional regulator